MTKSAAEAVKDKRSWNVNKAFLEKQLTEYRNHHNGIKDDCVIIFANRQTGSFNYASNSSEGKDLTPFELAGLLEVVKVAAFNDAYNG